MITLVKHSGFQIYILSEKKNRMGKAFFLNNVPHGILIDEDILDSLNYTGQKLKLTQASV